MVDKGSKRPVERIAELAGVSRAAAYAALNPGRPSTIGVSAEKRRKVLEAARQVGYTRNELARALSTGKSRLIGVCVQSTRTTFFSDFFALFDERAQSDGYAMVTATSEFSIERERSILRSFAAKQVDGLVVASCEAETMHAGLSDLNLSASLPFILLGEESFDGIASVSFDEKAVGRLQATHLFELGHRAVAYIGATKTRDQRATLHAKREQNFNDAWAQLSTSVPLSFAVKDHLHGGAEIVDQLVTLLREGKSTAVACADDLLAMSLVTSLLLKGVRVPEACSIIGVDDLPQSADFRIPLSTVRLPTSTLAEKVWELLRSRLDGSQGAREGVTITPELVARRSTTPPRQSHTPSQRRKS